MRRKKTGTELCNKSFEFWQKRFLIKKVSLCNIFSLYFFLSFDCIHKMMYCVHKNHKAITIKCVISHFSLIFWDVLYFSELILHEMQKKITHFIQWPLKSISFFVVDLLCFFYVSMFVLTQEVRMYIIVRDSVLLCILYVSLCILYVSLCMIYVSLCINMYDLRIIIYKARHLSLMIFIYISQINIFLMKTHIMKIHHYVSFCMNIYYYVTLCIETNLYVLSSHLKLLQEFPFFIT